MTRKCLKMLCPYLLLCYCSVSLAYASVNASPYLLSLSLLSYSHFPNSSATTFCIVGSAQDTSNFQKQAKESGFFYRIIGVNPNTFLRSSCQAVYFSPSIPLQNQNSLLQQYPNLQLLSFTANDDLCESRNIFCLYQRANQYYFKVNLDSLTLSKVHIDPRVLLLAKNYGE
jgi:hypothetical protein